MLSWHVFARLALRKEPFKGIFRGKISILEIFKQIAILILASPKCNARTYGVLYPEPQNAPHVSGRMNVLDSPEDPHPKATCVNSWYGVYPRKKNHYILAQEE